MMFYITGENNLKVKQYSCVRGRPVTMLGNPGRPINIIMRMCNSTIISAMRRQVLPESVTDSAKSGVAMAASVAPMATALRGGISSVYTHVNTHTH